MVDEQLVGRHIDDARVLDVLGRIERHRFVPEERLDNAYGDSPVPVAAGQTLSQPYVVALMTQALELEGCEKVLEVGTGTGYQTAVLASLVREVFTIEVIEELAVEAKQRLEGLGYDNIRYRVGDGRLGWPEQAPFDAILVAAAPRELPLGLREQLSPKGRLVIPVGPTDQQELELHEREPEDPSGFRVQRLGAVRFVPLV